MLSPRALYRALETRDRRFDGRVFVGVTSTGIYCRPVCPARPPKRENCRFFFSAAAAQEAGFRPCLRCRPESAPEGGAWRGTSTTVTRALALIGEGALDHADGSVDDLAERVGVGSRQLRRLFDEHLGASPVAVAQTRRVLFAKHLLHETDLPMAEVALAAGFGSLRRFNELFRRLFARPPSALRRGSRPAAASAVTMRLRYRAPYDWEAILGWLRARALAGVEHVDARSWTRVVVHDGKIGTVTVSHVPERDSLLATVRFPSVSALFGIVARVRRMFDLGADVSVIGAHLKTDPKIARLVARRPGLRVPGAWDGFELGVRAVLGQQVSLVAGRKLTEKLVQMCKVHVSLEQPTLTLAFPSAPVVAATDLSALGMPAARRETLRALAVAATADPRLFDAAPTLDETVARLLAIRGIGEWTAHYIALRAAREPDAFPASDVALVRSYRKLAGEGVDARSLGERMDRLRPWRAYAAQHLWTADADATEDAR